MHCISSHQQAEHQWRPHVGTTDLCVLFGRSGQGQVVSFAYFVLSFIVWYSPGLNWHNIVPMDWQGSKISVLKIRGSVMSEPWTLGLVHKMVSYFLSKTLSASASTCPLLTPCPSLWMWMNWKTPMVPHMPGRRRPKWWERTFQKSKGEYWPLTSEQWWMDRWMTWLDKVSELYSQCADKHPSCG